MLWVFARILSVAMMGLAASPGNTAISSSDAAAPEPLEKSKEPVDKMPGQYWTPERLREAEPLEMPHPIAPVDIEEPTVEPPYDDEELLGGEGEAGAEGIAPDTKNLLEGELSPKPGR